MAKQYRLPWLDVATATHWPSLPEGHHGSIESWHDCNSYCCGKLSVSNPLLKQPSLEVATIIQAASTESLLCRNTLHIVLNLIQQASPCATVVIQMNLPLKNMMTLCTFKWHAVRPREHTEPKCLQLQLALTQQLELVGSRRWCQAPTCCQQHGHFTTQMQHVTFHFMLQSMNSACKVPTRFFITSTPNTNEESS